MRAGARHRGMTLLEMLLAMAIVGLVLLVIGHTINMMQNTWVKVRGKADGFRGTRLALDTVARRISQATLASRWTVDSTTSPPKYVTESDLHFVCGPASQLVGDQSRTVGHGVFFQAPFGVDTTPNSTGTRGSSSVFDKQKMDSTLNAWGFFVEYGPDNSDRPNFMAQSQDRFPERHRFRLLEFRQPAHELSLFNMTGNPAELAIRKASTEDQLYSWFRTPLRQGQTYQARHLSVVAENILALIITPLDPRQRDANSDLSTPAPYQIAHTAVWNSRSYQLTGGNAGASTDPERHSMPPAVQLTAIALSEDSWLGYVDNGQIDGVAYQLMDMVNRRFQRGETLAEDIASISQELDARRPRIGYRIVTILVPLSER